MVKYFSFSFQEYKKFKYAINENLREKYRELFASCKSASAQQDLHDQLLQTVFRECSQSLGFKKVFLGDNSTTLSIRILSQVALGRGAQLPMRVVSWLYFEENFFLLRLIHCCHPSLIIIRYSFVRHCRTYFMDHEKINLVFIINYFFVHTVLQMFPYC